MSHTGSCLIAQNIQQTQVHSTHSCESVPDLLKKTCVVLYSSHVEEEYKVKINLGCPLQVVEVCCVLVGSVAVRKVLTRTLGAQDDVSTTSQALLTCMAALKYCESMYISLVSSPLLQLWLFCSTNTTTRPASNNSCDGRLGMIEAIQHTVEVTYQYPNFTYPSIIPYSVAEKIIIYFALRALQIWSQHVQISVCIICHNGCMAVLLHLFLLCRHRPTLSPSFSPSSPCTKTSTHSSTHVLLSLTFFHPAMPSHFLPPCCCLWEAWLWGWWCGGWWGDCVGGGGGYRRKRALPQQVPTCLR